MMQQHHAVAGSCRSNVHSTTSPGPARPRTKHQRQQSRQTQKTLSLVLFTSFASIFLVINLKTSFQLPVDEDAHDMHIWMGTFSEKGEQKPTSTTHTHNDADQFIAIDGNNKTIFNSSLHEPPSSTTSTIASTNKRHRQVQPLNLIPNQELVVNDYFSASWLLPKERFYELDWQNILTCEGASFLAIRVKGDDKPSEHAKMLVDWTEFNVEHMSKWWGMLGLLYNNNNLGKDDSQKRTKWRWLNRLIQKNRSKNNGESTKRIFSHVISMMDDFTRRSLLQPHYRSTELERAIAMIAFMPVNERRLSTLSAEESALYRPRSKTITHHSLAATIASIFAAGFGRVVVVGLGESDHHYTQGAVQVLNSILLSNETNGRSQTVVLVDEHGSNNNSIATIGHPSSSLPGHEYTKGDLDRPMEIAHVRVTNPNMYVSRYVQQNLPRAAVAGMHVAMFGETNTTSNDNERIQWLGSGARYHNNGNGKEPSYWNYIYLTEPDTILNLNLDLLPSIRHTLDKGISLFPHRIHPIPHENNLPPNNELNPGLYLPNAPPFEVTELDPLGSSANGDHIACCDAGGWWPGIKCSSRDYLKQNCSKEEIKNAAPNNRCGQWWECGLKVIKNSKEYSVNDIINGHHALLEYKWMRLKHGIGVIFGSSNNGRTCIPSKTACDQKMTA